MIVHRPEWWAKIFIWKPQQNATINPNIYNKNVEQLKQNIIIKTIGESVGVQEKILLPLFRELGDPKFGIEMYVMKFHELYDGLIGNNILIPLRAKIDLGNETLSLVDKEVKLQFSNEKRDPVYNIHKSGIYTMKIPV